MANEGISLRRIGDVAVAAPVGRIDHAAAGPLEQTLAPLWNASADPLAGVVIDFRDVEYISSVGLRVLMIAAKEMRARHTRIAVSALQPTVAEIFAISRFDTVLEVFPGLREALQALSPDALAAHEAQQSVRSL